MSKHATLERCAEAAALGAIPHGTCTGYNYWRCRCCECKEAYARYYRELRAPRREQINEKKRESHYCGRCKQCRDLDAWLKEPGVRRMPWPKDTVRSYPRSWWPTLEAACRKWGPPVGLLHWRR